MVVGMSGVVAPINCYRCDVYIDRMGKVLGGTPRPTRETPAAAGRQCATRNYFGEAPKPTRRSELLPGRIHETL